VFRSALTLFGHTDFTVMSVYRSTGGYLTFVPNLALLTALSSYVLFYRRDVTFLRAGLGGLTPGHVATEARPPAQDHIHLSLTPSAHIINCYNDDYRL